MNYNSRGVRMAWKPFLNKSTNTLQRKWFHYKLQATNSTTTYIKVLEYLILTVHKYVTLTTSGLILTVLCQPHTGYTVFVQSVNKRRRRIHKGAADIEQCKLLASSGYSPKYAEVEEMNCWIKLLFLFSLCRKSFLVASEEVFTPWLLMHSFSFWSLSKRLNLL